MPTTSTASSWPRRSPNPLAGRLGPLDTAERLRELGVHPSRRWGQTFLVDPFIADAEAALLDVPSETSVLEIGAGLGILTRALLARGLDQLTVMERDPRLAGHLRATFANRISLLVVDALTVPWPKVGAIIGNLPFSLATPLFLRILSERIPVAVIMVQREVGERLAAKPGTGSFGRLTVWTALHGTAERFLTVPSHAFLPPPAVDGIVIRFRARDEPLPVRDLPRFERLLKGVFAERRKQLRNILPRFLGSGANALAAQAEWPANWPTLRAENLPPEAFFRLANLWQAPSGTRVAPASSSQPTPTTQVGGQTRREVEDG